MSSGDSNFSTGINNTLEQLTKYLLELQGLERNLYSILRNNPNIEDSEKEQIVRDINDLSAKRDDLNKQIKDLAESSKLELQVDFQTFQQQMRIVEAAEQQLNESKIKLKLLNDEKLNKLRLVQINTYYQKRYGALSEFIGNIVFFIIIFILISWVISKGWIPSAVGSVIVIIYLALGIVYFILYYLDIANRSKTNFDQYEWTFDKNTETKTDEDYDDSETDKYMGSKGSDTDVCVGEACCTEGMKYDEQLQKCVVSEEGMSNALSQGCFNSNSDIVNFNNNNGPVKPFSDNYGNYASF